MKDRQRYYTISSQRGIALAREEAGSPIASDSPALLWLKSASGRRLAKSNPETASTTLLACTGSVTPTDSPLLTALNRGAGVWTTVQDSRESDRQRVEDWTQKHLSRM